MGDGIEDGISVGVVVVKRLILRCCSSRQDVQVSVESKRTRKTVARGENAGGGPRAIRWNLAGTKSANSTLFADRPEEKSSDTEGYGLPLVGRRSKRELEAVEAAAEGAC